MDPLDYRLFYRRHLPHYQPPGATLFVTFRLAGSIPTRLLEDFLAKKVKLPADLMDLPEADRVDQVDRIDKQIFGCWDQALAEWKEGQAWLQDQQIALLVSESVHYGDGKEYDLEAFYLMPNHVHLLCTPKIKLDQEYYSLSEIMHRIKRFTARNANKTLYLTGDFWQHESWDHVVRDDSEKQRIVDYILNNPVKAGLVDDWTKWKWTYYKYKQS